MSSKGTTVPPEVYATWPKPNHVNPENNTALLLGFEISLIILTTIVVILRVYSRGFLTKTIGLDDWLMVGALIGATGLTVSNCLSVQYGWGVHLYDFTPKWLVPARKLAVATEVLFIPATSLAKWSILVFYKRIFTSREFGYWIWAGIAYIAAYSLAAFIVILLQAIPLEAYWNKSIDGKFINGLVFFCFVAGINCSSDLYVFLLPIREVWKIQLPRRQKLGIIAVFGLGGLVVIAGIVRIYYIYVVFDPHNWDFTWDGAALYIVTAVECDIGILCASLPALKPLMARYCPGLLGSTHNQSKGRPTYRLSSIDPETGHGGSRGGGGSRRDRKSFRQFSQNELSTANESEENILQLPIQSPTHPGSDWEKKDQFPNPPPPVHGFDYPPSNGIDKKVEIEVVVTDATSEASSGSSPTWDKRRTSSRQYNHGAASPMSPRRL